MHILGYILLANFIISCGGLIGLVTLFIDAKRLNRTLLFLVSLSAGVLMGGAFLHLLPETLAKMDSREAFTVVLAAFGFFFFIEKLFHWRHCHKGADCDIHTFGYMNLVGDSIHNFIDGLVVAGAFLTSIELGVVTSVAVALHEIPQEIGDFGVLIYSGFSRRKALTANFLVALTAMLGGVVGYALSSRLEFLTPYLLALAAGGFIYIAASDLMPEIRKVQSLKKSLQYFSLFILGVVIMYVFSSLDHI